MKKKNRIIIFSLLVSAITLLLIELFEWRDFYELMLIYSIFLVIIYSMLIYEEIKHYKGLNLNLLLLLGFFIRLVFPSITKAWGAIEGEEYSFIIPENVVNDYMFPTIVWMNIFYMIFYWCVFKWVIEISIEDMIRPFFIRYNIIYIAIPLFIIGLIYQIITSLIPVGIIPSSINSILGQLTTLSILSQLFNAIFNPSRFNNSLFTIFIILSAWVAMFFGFSKGAIMFNFLYYILYYFLKQKYYHKKILTPKLLVLIFSFFIIIDLIIYPFMSTKRVVSGWDPSVGSIATVEYSNMDILIDVLQGKVKKDENTAAGRLDAITPNAFYYKECCKKNLRTAIFAIDNAGLLIPRFLYPEKHDSRAGIMAYSFALNGSFDTEVKNVSFVYIGQFASSYMIGGPLAVLVLAFFNGWFLVFYYNFLLRHRNNILAILLLLPFMMSALMAFEEIHDGGLLRIGYNTAMMILILTITLFFPKFLRVKKLI